MEKTISKARGMDMKKGRRGAKGFSLIELLLVIGFISGALVMAFVTYPKVQATNRANVESQHLIVLAGGIKNLYATAKSYNSLDNTVLLNARVVPDDLQVNAPTINNIWGGTITAAPTAGNPLNYTIEYTGIPSSECTKLATSVAVNFQKLVINYDAPLFDRMASGGSAIIDPGVAAASCGAYAANILTFTGN